MIVARFLPLLLVPIASQARPLPFRMSTRTAVFGWAWSKPEASTVIKPLATPPAVSGHLACSDPGPTPVFLFGGLTGPAGSPTSAELYEYDLGGWRHFPPKEGEFQEWPRQRMYPAGGILGQDEDSRKLYLFGGWDPGAPGSGGEFLKDIWSLDLVTKEWKKLDLELPFPVSRHSACSIGDSMIVLVTFQGVLVFQIDGDGKPSVVLHECTGDAPDGLSMAAQVALGSNGVLLFGGSTKTQQLSADAYYLETGTWKWTKLMSVGIDGGPCPVATASPCAAAVAGSVNEAIVFGGASISSTGYEGGAGLTPLNVTWLVTVDLAAGQATWKKIDSIEMPEPRLAASLTCIFTEGGNRMLLQGGYDSTTKETFGESWILSQ